MSLSTHHTNEYFLSYLPLFEKQVYPLNPVLDPDEIRAAIATMHTDCQDRALVYAFGAVTINLTETNNAPGVDLLTECASLMSLSLQAHRQAETGRDNASYSSRDLASSVSGKFGDLSVNFKRIMACIFLEICFMAFKRWDRSLQLLREAMTMIQVLDVHQYETASPDRPSAASSIYGRLPPRDIFRLKRVYWEVYIHERFLSTVTGYPCIMPPLKAVPIGDTAIPPNVDLGFNRLINLFRVLDGPFLAHWSAQRDPTLPVPNMTAHWIESKQSELDRDEEGAAAAERSLSLRGGGGFTEVQHVDLFVTRVWLRTLVWQFALHHGLLRSTPPQETHEGLSLHFPAQRLSAQLRDLVSHLEDFKSIVTHGCGILQKLFEITSTVADVLALPRGPGQTEEEARARLEDFEFLVRFLFSFERIEKSQRDYLREKLGVLGQQYTIVDFATLASASPGTGI